MFEAEIFFSETCKSPRYNGVLSGYRPCHQFKRLPGKLWSGIHYYDDPNRFYRAGDRLPCIIELVCWDTIKESIFEGDYFLISEASRKIGIGKVTSIDHSFSYGS